jgi:hypothetical protein
MKTERTDELNVVHAWDDDEDATINNTGDDVAAR